MWFEADANFPFSTIKDFSLSEPTDFTSTLPENRLVSRLSIADRDWTTSDSRSDYELFSPPEEIAGTWDSSSAGKGGDRVMNDDGVIVVTGTRTYRLDSYSWWDSGPGADYWTVHADGWGEGGGFDSMPDNSAIDVTVNFDRELTASESAAFETFLDAIEALTVAINALADDAEVRMPNGAYMTGAALKALWAETDFIIYDNKLFDNGTRGGEARMDNGNPTVSFNIQYLDGYDNLYGGTNYLIAHDFAHLTQYGMPYYYDQLTANDLAREILSAAGLPYLSNPEFGYSTISPIGFSTPGVGGNGGPSGGGEDGGGGGGDYIP